MADHHHAVQHRLAEQRDESDRRRDAEVDAGDVQRQNAADQRERHVEQDQRGALHGLERLEQQNEDQQDADRE